MATFSTSLKGRTPAQIHNARLAAEGIDGLTVKPEETVSYNKTVRSWSLDQGYVKAPVSFDGEMIAAFGGGVCQTSSTLYNAVLLSGLQVVERHPHSFCPSYVAPGRDAAVAFPGVDLRFRNPYPFPVRIMAKLQTQRLTITVLGRGNRTRDYSFSQEMLAYTAPSRLTRDTDPASDNRRRRYLRTPGSAGYRVATYRITHENGREIERERLSDDTYPAMDRVVAISQAAQP
jgi:vancomycin resistance protein YoaR